MPRADVIRRTLPDGWTVHYLDGPHQYWLEPPEGPRFRVPSPSGIVGVLGKPALIAWSARETAEAMLRLRRLVDRGKAEWPDEGKALAVLKKHGLDTDSQKERKGDLGQQLHDMLEAWAARQAVPVISRNVPEEQAGKIRALANFLLEHRPEVIDYERVIASVKHRYAGRYDLLVRIGRTPVRLDLKTAKRVYPVENFLQLEGYEVAARECGDPHSDVRRVLLLKPDGTYLWPISTATAQDWLDVLRVYRVHRRLSS